MLGIPPLTNWDPQNRLVDDSQLSGNFNGLFGTKHAVHN